MKRFTTLAYGIICYAVFFATFLYAIGFIGNLIVPKSIDSVPTVSLGTALFINTLWLAVFAIQHSVMARPFFKRAWTRIAPEAAERSTYVLFSSLALILLFALWQPMGGVTPAAFRSCPPPSNSRFPTVSCATPCTWNTGSVCRH